MTIPSPRKWVNGFAFSLRKYQKIPLPPPPQALSADAPADGVDAGGHRARRAPPQPAGGQRRRQAGRPAAAAWPGL